MAEYLIQDTTLDAIADAINAKTGGSSAMTPAEMVTEIGSIPTGGGGSGYAKKTGSFVLASDYGYANTLVNGYDGSILVDTGLSRIDSIVVWVEDWANKTMGDTTGVGCYFAINNGIGVSSAAASPAYYYSAYGVFKSNAANYFYGYTDLGGVVLHSACPNDVPEGSFGFQCRSSAYPIRSGMTVRWEAWGTE